MEGSSNSTSTQPPTSSPAKTNSTAAPTTTALPPPPLHSSPPPPHSSSSAPPPPDSFLKDSSSDPPPDGASPPTPEAHEADAPSNQDSQIVSNSPPPPSPNPESPPTPPSSLVPPPPTRTAPSPTSNPKTSGPPPPKSDSSPPQQSDSSPPPPNVDQTSPPEVNSAPPESDLPEDSDTTPPPTVAPSTQNPKTDDFQAGALPSSPPRAEEASSRVSPERHSGSTESRSSSSGGGNGGSGDGARGEGGGGGGGGGPSEGAVLGAAVAGVVVLLFVVLFVVSRVRRRKKRIHGLALQYKSPDSYYYGDPNYPSSIQSNTQSGMKIITSVPSGVGSHADNQTYSGQYESVGLGSSKSFFTYEEVEEMTNGFSQQNLLGQGGFGSVFKGWLTDGRIVAVKQLKSGSGQGEREFRAEVEIISRVHHRHLVSLVGYCISDTHRSLIYEFVPNKTLEYHLHDPGLQVMEWSKRIRIAIGSARGLAYLHEDCHPRIIHRDIKSANILIDDAFEAQVADFGLAKLTNDTCSHVSTRVMGTFGYMAPEYASSGKLTDRSDVFSFGVVLLELITGRKPVDASQPLGEESLVEWARPLLNQALESGRFDEVVDPRLGDDYVKNEMFRMMEAAAACVRHSSTKRPRMTQVLRALDTEGDLPDLSNGVKFGQSAIFDSNQYSADIKQFRRMAFESDSSDRSYTEEYATTPSQSGEYVPKSGPYRTNSGMQSSGEYMGSREYPPRPQGSGRSSQQYGGRGL